ncbi:MAG: lipopolysaccharide biosynthesis protein, partial [Frankiales bacterium]|nr:lipopolysaccharide biosynthesis protein [Frankiales bacterium]
MAADQSGASPGQLAAVVSRHRTFIGLIGLLGLLAGLAAGFLMPASYKASASVLVAPLEGNPYSPIGRGDDIVNLGTEAQLVSTDAVAKMARDRLRAGDPAALRAQVAVDNPPNTQVLNISFSGSARQSARAGAQAFAESYLDYRRQRTQNILDGKLSKLKDQSRRVQQELQAATLRLPAATGSQRTFLSQRISAYTNQLGIIDEQSNDLASTTVNPGQVITPAALPGSAGKVTGTLLGGAGGLVGGLLIGLGVSMLRARLERRISAAEGVERLGLRVLSVIPPFDDPAHGLALVDAPKSEVSDAYRRLRAATVAALPQHPVTILVSSATPGRTAMLTSSNLALALSVAGSSTIMIDAGAAGVDSAVLFGLRSPKGLSDTLLDGVDPATLLVHGAAQLRLLPRGARAEEATQRFSGPRMRDAAAVLRERADVVIINGPSLHDADAQALCTLTDAVLLIATVGVTSRDEILQARVEAERAGTTVIGAVVETTEMDRLHLAEMRRKAAPRREPRAAGGRRAAPA